MIGRHPWLTILVIGWAIGVAALYSFTRPTVYTAEAAVLVRPALTTFESPEGEVNPATESQVVDSTAVARLVSQRLEGNPRIPSLLRNVVVDVPENTEILRIQFTAGEPRRAREGADAFATSYLEFRREQAETEAADRVSRLQRSLEVLVPQIDELRAELQEATPGDPAESASRDQLRDLLARRAIIENQLLQAQAVAITPGEVIARALRPRSPSSPNHLLDLALGATVGLGLAFGLAYIRDRRWTGFESAGELERELGIPVSSVIPSLRYDRARWRDPIDLYRSNGPISDAYRTLRTSVLALAARSRLATIAVTSARPGEGTSTTAAMLAISLASTGHRVVLIDADLRRHASNTLGVEDTAGLADVLAGRVDSVNDTMQATSVPGLSVVPSGWADPITDRAELLESDRMRKVLEDCAGADFVVIDTPAVLAVADALVLARLTDGVLMVASAKGTTPQTVSYAALQLQRMGANLIGAVLVGPRRPEGFDLRYRRRGPRSRVIEDRVTLGRPEMVDRHDQGPSAAPDENRATVASTALDTSHAAPESRAINVPAAEIRKVTETSEVVPVAEGPVGVEPERGTTARRGRAGGSTRRGPRTPASVDVAPVDEEPSRSGGASPRRKQAGTAREESPPTRPARGRSRSRATRDEAGSPAVDPGAVDRPASEVPVPSPGTTRGDGPMPEAAPSPGTTPPTRRKPRARPSTSRKKAARGAAPETAPPAREAGPAAATDPASTPEATAADTPIAVTADNADTSPPDAGAIERAASASSADPVETEEPSSRPEEERMSTPEEGSTTPHGDEPGAQTPGSLGESDRTPDRNVNPAARRARTPAEAPSDGERDERGNGSAEPDSAEPSTNRA